jgi:AcrR family transcriptional regulator
LLRSIADGTVSGTTLGVPVPSLTRTAAILDSEDARLLDDAWRTSVGSSTTRHILIAAVLEFAERGFHATTTRDIAWRVGLAPSAMYAHFTAKEELLFRSMLIGHEQTLAMITAGASAEADPVHRLRLVIDELVCWQARYHVAARVNSYELDALSPEHSSIVYGLRARIDAVVRSILSDGVDTGAFTVPDIGDTSLSLLSFAVDVARWYPRAKHRSPEQVGAFYADLAERMVRA